MKSSDAELEDYLRLPLIDQCRLAWEHVGDASGREAAQLRREFAARVSSAMAAKRGLERGTAEYSRAINRRGSQAGAISVTEQAIIYRLSAWSYMLRSGIEPTPTITDAAFALANRTVARKDAFVSAAVRAIRAGEDPEASFLDAVDAINEEVKRRSSSRPW